VYWLCFLTPQGISVVIQPGASLVSARMKAALANLQQGEFSEGHELDRGLIKKIPKALIGRCLSQQEAQRLLKRLAKT
jgi:hypothetical protein